VASIVGVNKKNWDYGDYGIKKKRKKKKKNDP